MPRLRSIVDAEEAHGGQWYDRYVLSEPEDYGFSPIDTLRFASGAKPPRDFDKYWAETRDAIQCLPNRWQGSLDGPINQIILESWRSVRIVGRLVMPESEPRGAVITTHGYEADDDFPDEKDDQPWTACNLIALRLRVRGFPPSTIDVDDLRVGWITRGIESSDAWILRGAVIDVIQAYRCLRRRFGEGLPIALHGESFGGGLAVIAAAQLAAMGDPPHRLALGLPTFGDWRWRRKRYCNGAGGEVCHFLEMMRQDAHRIMQTLFLFDSTLHAQRISMPTLCKLAMRDDVVPAPTAAAVFNAMNATEKWCFITRFGHFDGGLADARRHALFERIHPEFVDPSRVPAEVVASRSAAFNFPSPA